jgi:hypothetical protein
MLRARAAFMTAFHKREKVGMISNRLKLALAAIVTVAIVAAAPAMAAHHHHHHPVASGGYG